MKRRIFTRRAALSLLAAALFLLPSNFYATHSARVATTQPNIRINSFLSLDKVPRGRTVQAAVVMEIPHGYHVNSNRPGTKYSIPTVIKVDAPGGVRVSPVSYPRALARKFSFSEDRISVYEGRAVMRFNVTIPANFNSGVAHLRLNVRYQSCTDEVCFPPVTRSMDMPVPVIGANESSRSINGQIFGGRRRGK